LYWKKDYAQAINWFEKLIFKGESSEFIHEKLGICHAKMTNFEEAIDQLEKALDFNSENAKVMIILGDLYERIQEFEMAEKYILEAIKVLDYPLDREYTKLGSLYNYQGDHQKALIFLKKAIKENSKNEQAQFFLLNTLNTYFVDIDERIKLLKGFQKKFPKSEYSANISQRLKEAKERKFLGTKDD